MIHTYDEQKKTSASIAFVGTRKDKVKKLDRERLIKYLALSTLDYVNKYPN